MSAQFIPHNLELRWDVSSLHLKLSFLCVFIPDKPDLSVVCTRGTDQLIVESKKWTMTYDMMIDRFN